MKLDSAEDRSVAAGEYVLGTLDTPARTAFEAALVHDRALQAEVARWQDRLLPLARHAEPVDPPAELWPAIEARLKLPPPAAQATPERRPGRSGSLPWWQRLGLWQGLSGAALTACVLLGSALLGRAPAPAERYVAVLQAPQGGGNGWVVEVQIDAREAGSRGRLRLRPLSPGDAPPQGRSLQFWTKAPGAAGPKSLGLLRAGGDVELPLAQLPGMRAEQLFEITLEPEGGSPLDRPTGPVLFIGRAVRLSS